MKYTYLGVILIACLTLGLCVSSVAAANNFGSGTAFLEQGKAHTFTVIADFSSQIIMTPPAGANFDLYAFQCQSFRCSCPTSSYVMQFATYSSRNGVGRKESLTLPSGTWCVVVFAQSGSGTYTIYENQIQKTVPMPIFPPIGQGQASGMIQFGYPGQGLHTPGTQFGYPGQGQVSGMIQFANPGQGLHTPGAQFEYPGQGQPNRLILFGNPTQGLQYPGQGQTSGVIQI